MNIKTMLGLLIFMSCFYFGDPASCGDTNYGFSNSEATSTDSLTGYGFLHTDTDDYEIKCCGFVNDWKLVVDNPTSTSHTVSLQIWRPVTGGYQLVGENDVTFNGDGQLSRFDISAVEQIAVQDKDVIGWYSSGSDVIAYRGGGEGNNRADRNYKYPALGAVAVDTVIDWTSGAATREDDRDYGIEAGTTKGNDPTLTGGSVTILNTQGSGVIFTIVGSDLDPLDADTLVLSDRSGDAQFSLNTTSGEISVTTLTTNIGTITLDYRVTDTCGNTGDSTLIVTIDNPSPVFYGPFNTYISEDIILETQLFVVNVSDPGDTVTCSINTAGTPFLIRVNGTDTTIRTKSSPGFDYDTTSEYDVTVSCTDQATTVTQDYTVYLLENQAPVITNLQNSTKMNSTTSVGYSVFEVMATDNENDNLAFTLTCEASIATCPFDIADDGTVSLVSDLTDLTGLTVAGYDVFITVNDNKNTGQTRTLTILIEDINDAVLLVGLPMTVSVNENNAVGDIVQTMSFTDSDTSQSHSWALSSSPASSYFSIDSSGVVTLTSAVNYESLATDTYALSVTVRDPLTSDTGILTVVFLDVNEAPSFGQASYGLSVPEATAGTTLGSPVWGITDQDTSDSYTLSMDCGTYASYFQLDSGTESLILQADYDMDSGTLPSQVVCQMTVTDANGLTGVTNLTITFSNSNDNTPSFVPDQYTFFVSYYASTGDVVGSVSCTDGDAGTFGQLSFSIDQTSIGVAQLAVDTSGQITISVAPGSGSSGVNYTESHVITVTATDGGGLSDVATVTVVIGDTTTVPPTTTTVRYKTFFEIPTNLAWFTILMLILAVTACLCLWLAWTCRGEKGCTAVLSRLRRICKKGPMKYDDTTRHQSEMVSKGSVRQHPPATHSWQQQGPSSVNRWLE